jgi:SAM-dependent methyltransferase
MTTPATQVEFREPMPLEPSGSCWVCGGTEQDRVWSDPLDLSRYPQFGRHAHAEHPPSWLVRCRACGFGQPESLPATADYFDRLYDFRWTTESLDGYYETDAKLLIYREVLAGLERHLAPGIPKTVLDVGTGAGRFLELARQAGWQAEGAELNPSAAAYAAARTGLPVHSLRAQDLAARGRQFGAVTLTDVLEHIPRPAPLIDALRRLLYPGGVLAVKVPHGPMQRLKEILRRKLLHRADAWILARYIHVGHFTVRSLRQCLDRAGFGPVTITLAGPELWSAPLTVASRPPLSHRTRLLAYRAGRLIPGAVHTPLSLHLQAFAVNPGGPHRVWATFMAPTS